MGLGVMLGVGWRLLSDDDKSMPPFLSNVNRSVAAVADGSAGVSPSRSMREPLAGRWQRAIVLTNSAPERVPIVRAMRITTDHRVWGRARAGFPMRAAALCVLVACSGDADESAPWIVDLTEIHLFDANESLNVVRSLSVDASGEVWVLGGTEPFVHRYDSTGKLLISFGRGIDGSGGLQLPDEVLPPTAADPHVIVWSAGSGQLNRFRPDGAAAGAMGPVPVSSVDPTVVEQDTFARVLPMARWGRGFLLQDQRPRKGPGPQSTMSLANSALVALDSGGAPIDTVVEFRTLISPRRPASMVTDLAPLPVWTVCGDGAAAVVDPYAMRVRWYGPDGRRTSIDTLALEEQPITDADIERWLRNRATVSVGGRAVPVTLVEDDLKDYLGARRAELGTVAPPAVRVLCDEGRTLWLQRYITADEPRGLGREWVIFSKGRVVRRYRFPPRFQPMALHGAKAIGILRDSLGIDRVAAVNVPRP